MSCTAPRRPDMRHPPCAIECRCDGDQVYACIGNPEKALLGESGLIAFGDTLADALRHLADEIEREVGWDPVQWTMTEEQRLQGLIRSFRQLLLDQDDCTRCAGTGRVCKVCGATHADLVAPAARWLKGTVRCGVVLTEAPSMDGESPDAIGWRSGYSVLVECKASRADFLADSRKPHRVKKRRLAIRCYYLTLGQARCGLSSAPRADRRCPAWKA